LELDPILSRRGGRYAGSYVTGGLLVIALVFRGIDISAAADVVGGGGIDVGTSAGDGLRPNPRLSADEIPPNASLAALERTAEEFLDA